jgi:hypothetical protein
MSISTNSCFKEVMQNSEIYQLRNLLFNWHFTVGIPPSRFEVEVGKKLHAWTPVPDNPDEDKFIKKMEVCRGASELNLYCRLFTEGEYEENLPGGSTLKVFDYRVGGFDENITQAVTCNFFKCLMSAIALTTIRYVVFDAYSGLKNCKLFTEYGFFKTRKR